MPKLVEQQPPAICRRLETTDADVQAIDRADLVRMLFLLHMIRAFEIRCSRSRTQT